MIDEADNTVLATARANERLTSKIVNKAMGEPKSDQDAERQRELKTAATSSATSNVAASADAFQRLRSAARGLLRRTSWTLNRQLYIIGVGRYYKAGNEKRQCASCVTRQELMLETSSTFDARTTRSR